MLPSFHGERLGVYEELIASIAHAEIDRWTVGSEFAIHPAMQAITLRVILGAVFGIEDAARRDELERLLGRLINSPALPVAVFAVRPRSAQSLAPVSGAARSRRLADLCRDRAQALRPRARLARRHSLAAAAGPATSRGSR